MRQIAYRVAYLLIIMNTLLLADLAAADNSVLLEAGQDYALAKKVDYLLDPSNKQSQ